ncbi:hypothetical protein [Bacillus kexueae]|uniref:hypothetical protein n=1 Tax=Aeribacillus kexueae TaxID=2078952 RepID=UPI001FAF0659|nr:hypothetical protein [Bacillus kexueae]
MYEIMYTKKENGHRMVQVMSFHTAQIIRFTMDEYEAGKLPKSLHAFIESVEDAIHRGKWEQNYSSIDKLR